MIVTEVLTDEGFNSANSRHREKRQLYSNHEYWSTRTRDFYKVLPCLNGIIAVSEELSAGYMGLSTPTFYLPLAAPPHHAPLERFSREDQDIDVIFTGALTNRILSVMRQHGG